MGPPWGLPWRAALLGALLAAAAPAGAIVPVALRPIAALPEGLSGENQWSLAGRQGNSRTLAAGLDLALRHRSPAATHLFLAGYDYGRSLGRRTADRAFLHLRRIRPLAPPGSSWRPAWELLLQGQRDAFQRLRLRLLAGGGLRLERLAPARSETVAGLGLLRVLEDYRAGGGAQAVQAWTWRLNLYGGLRRPTGAGSAGRLEAVLYLQPRLQAPADVQALGQLRLLAPLGPRLALSLSLEAGYDSRPPAEVLRTDLRYRSGLRWRY